MLEQVVSVNTLKSAGFSVRVNHFRQYYRYKNGQICVASHFDENGVRHEKVVKDLFHNSVGNVKNALVWGGMTTVQIFDQDGNEFVGVSRCLDSDQFCKKTGVQFAIVDAVRKLLVAKAV